MLIKGQIVGKLVDVRTGGGNSGNQYHKFEAAFTRHHRTVFRAAIAIIQDDVMAEDVK